MTASGRGDAFGILAEEIIIPVNHSSAAVVPSRYENMAMGIVRINGII